MSNLEIQYVSQVVGQDKRWDEISRWHLFGGILWRGVVLGTIAGTIAGTIIVPLWGTIVGFVSGSQLALQASIVFSLLTVLFWHRGLGTAVSQRPQVVAFLLVGVLIVLLIVLLTIFFLVTKPTISVITASLFANFALVPVALTTGEAAMSRTAKSLGMAVKPLSRWYYTGSIVATGVLVGVPLWFGYFTRR